VCGGGAGLVTLVMRAKGIKIRRQARVIVERFVDLSQSRLKGAFKEKRITEAPAISELALSAYACNPLPDEPRAYMHGRGFTDEIMAAHGIGYDRHAKRITIPIRNRDERLVAIIGRSIRANPKRRYLLYDNPQKEFMLLGWDHVDWRKPVLVVEGSLDYLMARQHGFRNTVCLLGSHASPWQLAKLNKAMKLLLFLDNDEAGADGSLAIIEDLPDKSILVPCYEDKDKDVGAMSYDRFLFLIRSAKPPYSRTLKAFD
jgi:5S rRNA maturation endonuclease (ribonuclease M5)